MKKVNIIREIQELKNQLSYSKQIGFLLGAGTSVPLGVPSIVDLTKQIEESLAGDIKKSFLIVKDDIEATYPNKSVTIEDILTQLRRIRDITRESSSKEYMGISFRY